MSETANRRKDFFISYTGVDRQWAEWIAFELEATGYEVIIQVWDFRPGSNFVAAMDEAAKQAERTLLVLSTAYLISDYAFAEWAAAFRHDPKGMQGKVLPVRIERCTAEGLLGTIVYIDLVDKDETQARELLLAGVMRGRAKPSHSSFPGPALPSVPLKRPAFPGALPPIWNVPHPRCTVFTGREEQLAQLTGAFQAGQAAALSQPQAVSGLGGVGKTQIALEYAYRYGHRLRFCAFLAPDAIPEAMITQGAEHLGPNLASVGADDYLLNQAIEALGAYSLLARETSSSADPHISVHRLVQAVLKDQSMLFPFPFQ